jgi:hypothetical protein
MFPIATGASRHGRVIVWGGTYPTGVRLEPTLRDVVLLAYVE